MDSRGEKRPREARVQGGGIEKRQKNDDNKWSEAKKKAFYHSKGPRTTIGAGDQGILATCQRGHEAKAVNEIIDLFNEYGEKYYGTTTVTTNSDEENDIEAEINAELKHMQDSSKSQQQLFTNVTTDTQCILLIKTRPPVEPAAFVRRVCRDLLERGEKRTRFLNRLAPMTGICKPTVEGLQEGAPKVLDPHFGGADRPTRTFAIRPNLRNHSKEIDRERVIKQVATLVGSQHKVDLKGYELLIVAEVYKNILGLAVVENDFDELKRYNVAEIYDASRATGDEGDPTPS